MQRADDDLPISRQINSDRLLGVLRSAVDVAIIGGGVAGSAAAVTLADRGLAVALITPGVMPAERIGESLSPAANPLLRELGLSNAFAAAAHRPANATYSAWGSAILAERNAIVHLDGTGYVLDRASFEVMLAEAAAARGTACLADRVIAAARDGRTWSLTLAGGNCLATRFVLDCSGRTAVMARRLAVPRRVDRLVAAYAFLRQSDQSVEPTPATLIEAVPQGWWYASLLPDKRMTLALFADPDTMPRGVSRDAGAWRESLAATSYIGAWLDSAGYRADLPPQLASAATTWLEPPAGPGWAAAGDAAAAFDPLSSHGLTTALWGGRHAALAAVADLAGDPTPLARYAATLRDAMAAFLRQRASIYAHERRWADRPFWQRRAADATAILSLASC